MRRSIFVLRLAYDGGDFRGWQAQPSMRTIQGETEAALTSLLGEDVRVHGAARTDAGVHARGQVAHFSLGGARRDKRGQVGRREGTRPGQGLAGFGPDGQSEATRCDVRPGEPLLNDLQQFLTRLAAALPGTIRPLQLAPAPPSFHARASALGKRYRYRFSWGAAQCTDAFHLGLAATPQWERAREALRGIAGLTQLPGLSSPSTDRRPAPPLDAWQLEESEGVAALAVCAAAFRKHQVRNLAGHLAAIALGLAAPETLCALAARRRPWMGATAPPHGLCLEEVIYPDAQNPFPR